MGSRNPPPAIFKEIFRISKNQIIFGGNYFAEYLYNSPCWLIWDKDNNTNHYADCELAWTSFKSAVRKFKYTWNGMLQEDMKNKETRYHPTQKPVELFKRILLKYSKEGDIVCDPFLGSGTTALACLNCNRNYIGIEKEDVYIAITNKRISEYRLSHQTNPMFK
jgi:site-specific DNA-methyltransferase (adenine-specific)